MTGTTRRNLLLGAATSLMLGLALAPWWRNHGYLRDLYDYGLVIAGNGHLNLGERPYVDFTTPIQAGFLGLNWMFERLGGGTYAGLTLGAAALIVIAAAGLPLLLARRLPWWAAVPVGAAVAVSAASQHTILWHNALGVITLAFATWAVACAPVVRRATWSWHGVAAAALFLGGVNKLNYQLVSVAVCGAWTLRAGFGREAGWGRVLASLAAILVAGVVAPVAAELAWTGASLQLWVANVVELPAGARTGILREILTGHFWVRPIHDYYGPLLLPQVGLVAAWLALWAILGCWPAKDGKRTDRLFVPVAALGALAAGAALLATNYEIAPLGLGAWLALLVSVWLGFGPTQRPVRLAVGLVLPALLLGGAAWWSAWLGQRSQFGYSGAPRADYVPATNAGPKFAFLRGLRLPPDVASSLEAVERSLPDVDEQGYRPVFYSLGTEWLERCFPTPPEKGKPLWVHWGTSYSADAIARLRDKFATGETYPMVLNTVARDEWPDEILPVLRQDYAADFIGPTIKRRIYRGRDYVDLSDSFKTLALLGGNLDGHVFHFDHHPLTFKQVTGDRIVLGTSRSAGSVLMRTPSYHARGVAIIARLPGAGDGQLHAGFKVTAHGAIPEDMRWGAQVELPAGQESIAVPFEFDSLGKMVELWVMPHDQSAGKIFAGFRELELTNSIEWNEDVPNLRPQRLPDTGVTPELAENLFGPIAWRPRQWIVRGGSAGANGVELATGGEMWLRTAGMTGEIRGRITTPSGRSPRVWVVWYKGGRLQIMQNGQVAVDAPLDFHVWTAEPSGWVGILVEAGEGSPVQVRVSSSTLTP
jgi:hypothetical protein